VLELFEQFGIWAVVDIAIIATIIYNLLILLRGTRAMQMVMGLVIIFGSVFLFTQFYPLNTLKWMVNKFYPSLIIVIVIIFQDDIRRVLSGMGKKGLLATGEPISSKALLDEITRAATALASQRIGALITIERDIILSRYIEVGVLLDARVSKEILMAIFHPTSPIHDGSVIIQQGRISAAGCFLPLTRDDDIDTNMGTRHRAAIGITQETDAVVVLVSEEGGSISLVADGKVSRGLTPKELRKALRNLLSAGTEKTQKPVEKLSFRRGLGNWALINKMRIFRSHEKEEA
jgi:diadenylate cyclase